MRPLAKQQVNIADTNGVRVQSLCRIKIARSSSYTTLRTIKKAAKRGGISRQAMLGQHRVVGAELESCATNRTGRMEKPVLNPAVKERVKGQQLALPAYLLGQQNIQGMQWGRGQGCQDLLPAPVDFPIGGKLFFLVII